MSSKNKQNLPKKPTSKMLVDMAHDRGYWRGWNEAAAISAQEYGAVFQRYTEYSSKMDAVLLSLAELRELAYAARIGINRQYYLGRLQQIAPQLAAAASRARNAGRILDPTGHQEPNTAIWLLVSDAQDGITAALAGDDGPLQTTFDTHVIEHPAIDLLALVNRGGRPRGPEPYSRYLRQRAQAIEADQGDCTHEQIARLILADLKNRDELSPLEEKALKELNCKRPDRVIARVMKD